MDQKTEEALAVAQNFIAALERRDTAALNALVHDDAVLEVPFPLAHGENTTGARRSQGAAIRAYLDDMKTRTSAVRFKNTSWHTTNDGLAMFRADGDITLSDGRPYPNTYLFLFEVTGGKIIHWWEYLNPVTGMRAFGGPLESLP